MRSILTCCLIFLLSCCGGCGEETSTSTKRKKPPIVKKRVTWLESLPKAVELSKDSGKPIMALFTGSDWCKFCSLLDYQILNTEAFASWAKEHVVLLELDFPQEKEISREIKEQNNALAARYRITGFPTVLFLTAEGQPLLKAGYEQVTAEQWISKVDLELNKAISKLKSQE